MACNLLGIEHDPSMAIPAQLKLLEGHLLDNDPKLIVNLAPSAAPSPEISLPESTESAHPGSPTASRQHPSVSFHADDISQPPRPQTKLSKTIGSSASRGGFKGDDPVSKTSAD